MSLLQIINRVLYLKLNIDPLSVTSMDLKSVNIELQTPADYSKIDYYIKSRPALLNNVSVFKDAEFLTMTFKYGRTAK